MKKTAFLSLLVSPLCLVAAPLVFEAETAVEIEAPVALVTNAVAGADVNHSASDNAYLKIPEGAGNPPKLEKGFAKFEIEIPSAGGYFLWARTLWEGECSNSFTIQIDDTPPFLFGEDQTFNAWHWVRYPVSRVAKPIQLTAGKHTIIFRNREDGVALDQFLLSSEKRFVPVAIVKP